MSLTRPHVVQLRLLLDGSDDEPDAGHPVSKKCKGHHEQRQDDHAVLRIPGMLKSQFYVNLSHLSLVTLSHHQRNAGLQRAVTRK